MREIKFRAWDEKNKVMHYDFEFIKSGIEGNDWIIFKSDKQPLDWERIRLEKTTHPFNNPYFQQQLKIMQFTGLLDKNGKEIYEGYIVKSEYDENINWEVYYEDAKFWLRNKLQDRKYGDMNAYDDSETRISFEECEVIGNIMENPELLNVQKD